MVEYLESAWLNIWNQRGGISGISTVEYLVSEWGNVSYEHNGVSCLKRAFSALFSSLKKFDKSENLIRCLNKFMD
ncbi:hypothetical protein CDAR_516521 [Caerostris darwini]|uniref:Uncharacterized protein n=1 Tax=Caerostris darwini TaxID=1538125 RepID=A0AAV4X095_9ARAC|nr:hypothetical protein CDAR_516521 [Caerostris darwini]